MKTAIKWIGVAALASCLSACGADTETEVSKCVLQGHAANMLRICMSAAGYDFQWETETCAKHFSVSDVLSDCYERRGAWRSTKMFFLRLKKPD